MKPLVFPRRASQALPLTTEQGRRQAVAFALRFAQGTALAPTPYEQVLLNCFVRGELTLDELEAELNQAAADLHACYAG